MQGNAEGNFLGKSRKNFFLSKDCRRYIVELCYKEGLSEGAVVEQAVRRMYEQVIGERPSSPPVNFSKWE